MVDLGRDGFCSGNHHPPRALISSLTGNVLPVSRDSPVPQGTGSSRLMSEAKGSSSKGWARGRDPASPGDAPLVPGFFR
jgi:hypothetical protein